MDTFLEKSWEVCKFIFCLAVFFLIVFKMVSCNQAMVDAMVTTEQYYTERGITGMHPLAVLNLQNGPIGSFSGSAGYFLFMGTGSVEGQIQPGTMVQIEWVVPSGMSQNISVPYDFILWDFSEEYVNPSFEFNFTQEWLSEYINKSTELINYNSIFEHAAAITIHTTRDQYVHDISAAIQTDKK